MDYEKIVTTNAKGEEISYSEYIAQLPLPDTQKDVLGAILAVSIGYGYELGFKAATCVHTQMDYEDPRLENVLKSLEPASKFDVERMIRKFRNTVY